MSSLYYIKMDHKERNSEQIKATTSKYKMEINGKEKRHIDDRIQVLPQVDVTTILNQITQDGHQDEAFYICNIADIIRKYENWKTAMPRIKTYYGNFHIQAVKCNDSKVVLQTLAALGTGFDCASAGEIKKVLSLGVHPNRIIFANPTKKIKHIEYAAVMGVRTMTFDNECELYKIKKYCPKALLVIRIRCDDLSAKYALGKKFGCDSESEALRLLHIAYSLKLDVVGVSYHIGSSCTNYLMHKKAICLARYVSDIAATMGYKFNLLDIGGGFPGQTQSASSMEEIGAIINAALEEYFPDKSLNIISEPGRYYVESAFTIATQIHSIKSTVDSNTSNKCRMYYVDTGVYGAFIAVLFKEYFTPKSLRPKNNSELYESIIWGPTCDASDKLNENVMLPEMDIGDWIIYENSGAYTLSIACEFNCIPTPKIHTVIDEENWLLLTEAAPFPMSKDQFVIGSAAEHFRTGLTGPNQFRTNYF